MHGSGKDPNTRAKTSSHDIERKRRERESGGRVRVAS